MFKVSDPGEDHRHAELIRFFYHFRVANGTAGLYYRRDAALVRLLNAVFFREKGIARKRRTLGPRPGLFTGYHYGIHPRHLSRTHTDGLRALA